MKPDLYGLMMKYPEPGAVKTRLGRDIGAEAAADVYRRVASAVCVNTARSSAYERVIFIAPASRRRDFSGWLPGEALAPQHGAGLGEVMANCIEDLFRMGASKAVITGADIPGLTGRIVEDAFQVLESADLVLGPAEDGGYYLIGMKRLHRRLFEGIAWGGTDVFRETIAIADREGLRWKTVATLSDLDTSGDLRRLEGSGVLRKAR